MKRKIATGLERFVLEVEDPRRQISKAKRIESLARIRRFSMLARIGGFSLRAVDIFYKQPPLTHLDSDLRQEELLLLYARRGAENAELDKAEITDILDFIYLELYPDGYSDNLEEMRIYTDKCAAARADLEQHVPTRARLLGVTELVREVVGS